MDIKQLRRNQAEIIEEKIHHRKLIAKNAMVKATIFYEYDNIEKLTDKLKSANIDYLIVVNKDDKFLGEISIEKIIKIVVKTAIKEPLVNVLDVGYHRGINFTYAKDYVKKHNNFVNENDLMINVLKLIEDKNLKYVPVLNDDKNVVGVITPSSLLSLVIRN